MFPLLAVFYWLFFQFALCRVKPQKICFVIFTPAAIRSPSAAAGGAAAYPLVLDDGTIYY